MTNVKQRGSYGLVCILYTWRVLYSTLVFPLSHNQVGQERGNNEFIVTSAKRVVSTLSVCLYISKREITTPQQTQVIFGGKDVECGTYAFR